MKKALAIILSAIIMITFTGCVDFVNRSYTAQQAGERFDELFIDIGEILKKYDIPFNASDILKQDDKECVIRSFDTVLENGDSFGVWLTYTFNEDGTGRETFYCGVTTAGVDELSKAYIDAQDYRYVFEIGHRLSNMSSTGKSVKKANELVELVREQVLTRLGSPVGNTYRKNAGLSEKYDFWNISFSLQRDGDDGEFDSTFAYEGLVNV